MKTGDKVSKIEKTKIYHGRVKDVYPDTFVDVVWSCAQPDWQNYAAQKESISELFLDWKDIYDIVRDKATAYANKYWDVDRNPNEHDNAYEDFKNGASWLFKVYQVD